MRNYTYVSHLQFPVLRVMVELHHGFFLGVKEASKLDQRPFGSLYHRGWIAYRMGKGFYATKAGREAYYEYTGDPRYRARPQAPLSHYFDPIAYQLKKPEKPQNHARLAVVA